MINRLTQYSNLNNVDSGAKRESLNSGVEKTNKVDDNDNVAIPNAGVKALEVAKSGQSVQYYE